MKYVLYNTRTSSIEKIFDYEYLIDGKPPRFPDYIHLLEVITIKDEIDFGTQQYDLTIEIDIPNKNYIIHYVAVVQEVVSIIRSMRVDKLKINFYNETGQNFDDLIDQFINELTPEELYRFNNIIDEDIIYENDTILLKIAGLLGYDNTFVSELF
jgi:hypothetical protein